MTNKADFFILELEVLEGLNLEKSGLDQMILNIEKESEKFVWEENIHFIYVNKSNKIRYFSRLALVTIAEYLEEKKGEEEAIKAVNSLLQKVNEEEEKNQIDTQIVTETTLVLGDDGNKIVLKNNRHWLNFKDVRRILKTTTQRLEKAFEDINRSDSPLILYEDFEDINDQRHYSFSGFEKICVELSEKLSARSKRLYVLQVPKVAIPIIEDKTKLISPSPTEIDRATKEALKKQSNKCQITGESNSETTLHVHHLYNKSIYPELAADQDNLLVIKQEIHREFHNWNEGTNKPCTIKTFIEFIKIQRKYGDTSILLSRLLDLEEVLKTKLKSRAKFLLLTPVVDRSFLGKKCFAMINSEKRQGKILATAKISESSKVCFQVNNEGVGIWISQSDLIN